MKLLSIEFVNKIKHINVLILNNNPIKKFPDNIDNLKNLQVL